MDFWSPVVAIEVRRGGIEESPSAAGGSWRRPGRRPKVQSAPARFSFYHATNPERMAHERIRGRFVSGHSNKRRST